MTPSERQTSQSRAGQGRDLVSDGNQTKYIINFIIKFISGFEKEMCQNAVAENVEREEELRNCAPSSEIFGIHSIIEIPD